MNPVELVISRRLRTTPFEPRVRAHGVKSFTVYNHMLLPVNFSSTLEEYEHLRSHVQLWDVAAERQVEVVGPDALELVELVTPRFIAPCEIGQCVYAPLADEGGNVVNDPVVLRLAEDRFWISIADSDVLLWLKGIAWGRGLDVRVFEPDVSPLAVQGPKADDLMADLLGQSIREIRFFRFVESTIAGADVLVARSGWSGQGGFEIYLQDSADGLVLWDTVWEAGEKYQIRTGAPNLIDRLETGLKSFGSDMTLEDSVLECGFDRYLDLDKPAPYMAKEALQNQLAEGVGRRLCHLMVAGGPLPVLRDVCDVTHGDQRVGYASSSAWSPKYEANLLFAMLSQPVSAPGTQLSVVMNGRAYAAIVKDERWKS